MRLRLIAFLFLFIVSMAWADPTASIFVKDASEFATIQKDLDALKMGLGQGNASLDSLWQEAGRIAKMNDRCAIIMINEALDDECSHFYAVELPNFETRYMEITGELRLGSMKMGTSLAERTEQIKACATALGGILVSKEQLLKLNGSVDLEPLSFEGAFDATYNFNLYFDSGRMDQQQRMMDRWLGKCGDIVLRKAGDEFAPLFIESVKLINDSLKQAKANVQIVIEPEYLDFYLDMNKSIPGAYYLNGAQLFKVEALPKGRNYAHIIVNFTTRKVYLPLGTDGNMQNFKGRVEFTSAYQDKDLVGRWAWGHDDSKANSAVAKGEISAVAVMGDSTLPPPVVKQMNADTTAAVEDQLAKDAAEMKAKEDAAKAAADAYKSEGSGIKVHWIPLAIAGAVAVGGGVMAAVFNNKAKAEHDKSPSSHEEYQDQLDKIESAQTMRNVGFGLMAVGIVGAGVTFLF